MPQNSGRKQGENDAGRTQTSRYMKRTWILPRYDLVTFTWGNVSGIDREKRACLSLSQAVWSMIKLTPEDMVVMDLDGNKIEGQLSPVLGYGNASGAVPGVSEDRRNRTYPFLLCYQLGPGRTWDSMLMERRMRITCTGKFRACAV